MKEITIPVKIAFYETLRKGFGFHEELKANLKFIGICELKGYSMYDLGTYPCLIYSGEPSEMVLVEVYEVLTKQALNMIDDLERAAGYHLEEIYIDDERFGIYVFKEIKFGKLKVISGDWKEYTRNSKYNF
jgi:gamma-glutamylcyclotransferase (GGCT)/AIG2-like uncharacterized protein YtfP